MIKIASLEIDLYTDRFHKDLEKIAEVLPDFVKETDFLSPEELGLLSDADFALCIRTADREFIRRFPIVDKGHTWMSAYYFLKNKAKLPKEAQEIAARNITNAMRKFNLDVPHDMACEIKEYVDENMSNGHRIFREGKGDESIGDLKEMESYSKEKTAAVYVEDKDRSSEIIYAMEKDAEQMMKEEDDSSFAIKLASGERLFYIGTEEDFLKVADSILENYKSADPGLILDMVDNMAKKASVDFKGNVSLGDMLNNIHTRNISTEMLKEAFDMRYDLVANEELQGTLELVKEKIASDNKDTIIRFLSEFDKTAGLNFKWDVLVPHPISMLINQGDYPIIKVAADEGMPSDEELMMLAQDDNKLKELYEGDMVKAFKENPREFYNALPDTHKDVIRQIIKG